MNVTEHEKKCRKSRRGSCQQEVSAEQRGNAGVHSHARIAENNNAVTSFQTDRLLEQILHRDNMNKAYKKVKSNKGAGGIDGMSVEELLPYLKRHRLELLRELEKGKYKPNPVRRVEIPKEEKGELRKLGIPTAVDRVVQQSIAQVLMPIYEGQFEEESYGFRPKRSAHDALKQCRQNVDDGYVYVVDMDLEKFFDTVCQSKLIEVLSRTITDGRVISLIHKYLNAGVINKGLFEKTDKGMPQGGPLSPLLSNIMLNELDKELKRRGHRFVRYADDCMIFCKSRRGAQRTLENIIPFIEKKLFLKVNRKKTVVAHISKVKYLGYAFYRYKGKCRFRVHPKSIKKMKDRLRKITDRNNGRSDKRRAEELKMFVVGWVNYFKMADMKKLLADTDEWIRRRIRAVYWKHWKRVRTKYRMIEKFGIPKWSVHEMANCRKGIWRAAMMLNSVLTTKEIARLGYMSMSDYYKKVCEN